MNNPNILLITTDQQRFDTIHALGCEQIETPNLDRLVNEGCCFTNAYSPNPVCIPARHNILTGLPAKYHGFDDNYFVNPPPLPFDLPTFAQIVTDDGEYDAIGIGKMHFLPCRRHNGFTNLKLMEEIPQCDQDDEYMLYLKSQGYGKYRSMHGVRHLLYMQPQQSFLPEEHHGSHWVADETIAYMRNNAGKHPFLIWSSFIAPHPPLDVPARFAEKYRGKPLPKPATSVTPLSNLAEENKCIADYPNAQYLKRARELYYGAISFVDYNIGRILDELEALGELDRTVIIFTSDHGEMLGDHGTYQKFLPYDGSAKIPMVIRYPKKIKPGSKREEFVDLNDLLPTIIDAAGKPYPGQIELPGESLFAETGKKDRTHQYIEHCKGNRRWVSLRNQRYKFNYYYSNGSEELFDMVNDPQETTNLLYGGASDAAQAARDELYAKLAVYEEKYGLAGYAENGKMKVLDEYIIQPYKEMNFPMHLNRLRPQEREQLVSISDEILSAIENEPVVRLEELDTALFREKSGMSNQEFEQMLARRRGQ